MGGGGGGGGGCEHLEARPDELAIRGPVGRHIRRGRRGHHVVGQVAAAAADVAFRAGAAGGVAAAHDREEEDLVGNEVLKT